MSVSVPIKWAVGVQMTPEEPFNNNLVKAVGYHNVHNMLWHLYHPNQNQKVGPTPSTMTIIIVLKTCTYMNLFTTIHPYHQNGKKTCTPSLVHDTPKF